MTREITEERLRERLRDGFAPFAPEPADERLRVEARALSAAAVAPRAGRRRVVRWMAVTASVAVALMAAYALFGAGSHRPSRQQQSVLQAAAAAVADGDILHYRTAVGFGGGPDSNRYEAWVDVRRDLALFVATGSPLPGTPVETETTLIHGNCSRTITQQPGGRTYVLDSVSQTQFHEQDSAQLAAFRHAIESGDASVVGTETLDGVETWRIETTTTGAPSPGANRSDVLLNFTRTVANVRTGDYMPVRIASKDLESYNGKLIEGGTSVEVRYELFERLDERTAPPNLFELPVPPGVEVAYRRSLSPSELATFTALPVWWLGRSWQGFHLQQDQNHTDAVQYLEYSQALERSSNPTAPPRPQGWPQDLRSASMSYETSPTSASPSGEAFTVNVMNRVDQRLWGWFSGQDPYVLRPSHGPLPTQRWVSVGSERALLLSGAEPDYMKLIIDRGDVTVELSGQSEARLLQVAAALKAAR